MFGTFTVETTVPAAIVVMELSKTCGSRMERPRPRIWLFKMLLALGLPRCQTICFEAIFTHCRARGTLQQASPNSPTMNTMFMFMHTACRMGKMLLFPSLPGMFLMELRLQAASLVGIRLSGP